MWISYLYGLGFLTISRHILVYPRYQLIFRAIHWHVDLQKDIYIDIHMDIHMDILNFID
jgi:hypothetical protein